MNYHELHIKLNAADTTAIEILIAELAEIGFESFVDEDDELKAYINSDALNLSDLDKILKDTAQKIAFEHRLKIIEQQNWNEEWEKNYPPIIVDEQCIIKAPFHVDTPDYPFEILIMPKMAFGTGHHATTSLMIRYILEEDMKEKTVLDMGSGTGVLAILANMKGAIDADAIDNDEWAFNNCIENININKVNNVKPCLGGAEKIPDKSYDVIIANINRNILLEQLPVYTEHLLPDSKVFLSGFYQADLPLITEKAQNYGLQFHSKKVKADWVAACFIYTGN